MSMEAWLAVMKKKLMRVLEAMGSLQKENTDLQRKVVESDNTTNHTLDEQEVWETQDDPKVNKEQMEKKKMCDELKELARRYKEMEK